MRRKKIIAMLLVAALTFNISVPTFAAIETVAGGYEVDMDDLPKVHFKEHKDWENLYNVAWDSHKKNIKKVTEALNPEVTNSEKTGYYVDEAFDDRIFQWDTLFMMLFDKYGINQFPTLNSMDNFYYHQVDSNGEDDGFINRMIYESNGQGYYDYKNLDALNPPLFGWAEWEQYKVHGDVERFTKEVKGKSIIDRIDSLYEFTKRTRRISEGPMKGFYVSTGQGNGLDNTPNQGGWNEAANDMTIQQVQAAEYIVKICEEILDKDTNLSDEEKEKYSSKADKYRNECSELKELVREKMWSNDKSFYFNAKKDNGEFTNVVTPTGLWSLAANIATEGQAKEMIENYALNSEKLFRPNGLSTTCYDFNGRKDGGYYNSPFKPTGGYWNGAVWAPTSYQWIKGLENYGYDDLAFQEAIRHVNTLSNVLKNGYEDRNGSKLNTIWENYSSEYDKPGSTEFNDMQPSRSNFVGWTGAIAIANIIENVIGIRLDSPNNTIEWNVNLIEEHGINNLYMKNNNGIENRVSLIANERINDSSPIVITSKADYPYTLNIKNNGKIESINVEEGTQLITVEGYDLGKETYLDSSVHNLETQKDTLAKEYLDVNAKDYVIFSDTDDNTINDGLKKQVGKEYKGIFNVNTIGYREKDSANPTLIREDEELSELGFDGAKDYVKRSHIHGEEGFMLMAPANNEMQTLKVVVGVQNATAKVVANISDGSSPETIQIMQGGDEEAVYVVEIPYRASSDGNNILVEYVITDEVKGKGGNISLKGIVLEDGGMEAIPAIEEIMLTSSDSALTVNGKNPEGMNYDSYKILLGSTIGKYEIIREVKSLPATIEGLKNYKKYYVTVVGVKNGVESSISTIKSEIPEAKPRTDRERAYADFKEVEKFILNGNENFESVTRPLNFDIKGLTYGSSFEITTSTDGEKYGISNSGSVNPPIKPLNDIDVEIKIKVNCGSENIEIVKKAIVKAKDVKELPYATGEIKESPDSFNITEEGEKDWILFNNSNLSNCEKKENSNLIKDINKIGITNTEIEGKMKTTISYFDGSINKLGSSKKAIYHRKNGNGIEFKLPYSDKIQNLKVFAGVWQAGATIELLINNNVVYTDSFEKVDGSGGVQANYFDIKFKAVNPTDEIKVKIYTTNDADKTWGGGFAAVQGISLKETDDKIPTPEEVLDKNVDIKTVNQEERVDLTKKGSKDWLLFNTIDINSIESKNTERKIRNLKTIGNPSKINPNSGVSNFSYSDGSIVSSGTHNKGVVFEGENKGITFEVPYSKNNQKLSIYGGAWAAKVTLEGNIKRNGETIKTITKSFDMTNTKPGSPAEYTVFDLNYNLENSEDILEIKIFTDELYDLNWGNMSISAITLSEVLEAKVDKNIENGLIDLSKSKVSKGDEVEVFILPNENKELKDGSLKYLDDNGEETIIVDNKFIMPDTNVTVQAEFIDINDSINVEKPINLKVDDKKSNSILLSWESPASNTGLVGYKIYKDGKEIAEVDLNTLSYNIDNLKSNTIYGFKVVSKYLNGELSKPISINTRTEK
ncbi:MGH1-like glycoside hydrolase domain-containing protein [Clostridium sp.]|uniref:MGH1-like glycoside hydrolase domain-containing protein n=1 Tax=Clostridium sp. TaxID=1506 RepID=UPI003F37FAD3